MFQVVVMLDCAHQNTLNIESPVFIPRKGDLIVCKICGKQHKVLFVGRPYQVKEKES